MYGGLTPGSPALFALLKKLGMTGLAVPVFAGVAVGVATLAAVIVYLWLNRAPNKDIEKDHEQ